MNSWFTVDRIDSETVCLSEYRHWEEPHCYLLCGTSRALLIDTGLGICSIAETVKSLTDLPVTAIATHIHWDHIGSHKYFPDFYAHEKDLSWLSGGFFGRFQRSANMWSTVAIWVRRPLAAVL